jgi:drug/metabolite transporter (DMT)-like permease
VVGAVAVTVTVWAAAFPAIRAGLDAYTPGHVALLRFLVASAALAVMALFMRMPLPALRDWPGITGTAILGVFTYHVALNTGEISVPAGTASVIVAAAPVITALLAVIFLRERLSLLGWIGIITSFGGVAFITLGKGQGLGMDARIIYVVIAALAQGSFFASQKPLVARLGALRYTTCALWAGTVILLVFTPGLFEQVQSAPLDATLSVVFLGIFPSAIGYATWAYTLSKIPASRASSFLYLIPAIAILISWLWLGETPTIVTVIGGVIVLAGVIMVNTWGKAKAAA